MTAAADLLKSDGKSKAKPVKKDFRCETCGVTSKSVRLCSACQTVGYCSVEHQKENWRVHRSICGEIVKRRTFTILEDSDEITGKCVVASKDLEKGGFILEESPLFQFNPTTEVTKMGQCVTCGDGIKNADDPKIRDKTQCSMCGWPVCSKECEKSPIHAENECRVFVENDGNYPEEKEKRDDTLGEFHMIARGFSVRSQKPELWEEILDIMPNYTLDEFNGLSQDLLMNALMSGKSISNMKSKYPKLLFDDEEEKLVQDEIRAQIIVLSRRVGYAITNDKNLNMDTSRMYIFKKASYFSNSCVPNCVWEIGPFPDFKLRIRAAVPIKKGDRLSVNRQTHFFWGVTLRQSLFNERYKRYCNCKICTDPTECGTFQSGITCPSCYAELWAKGERDPARFGYLLPVVDKEDLRSHETVVMMKDDAKWTCSRCKEQKPIKELKQKLGKLYNNLLAAEKDKSPEKIKNLLEKILEEERLHFLHPNHWIIQYAMNANRLRNPGNFPSWIDLRATEKEEKKEPTPKERQKLRAHFETCVEQSFYLLKILDKTSPGLQHERMRLLLMLGDGLINLCKDYCEDLKEFYKLSKEKVQELEVRFKMAGKFLEEALEFWKGAFPQRGKEKPIVPEYLTGRIDIASQFVELIQGHLAELYKEEIRKEDDGEE